MKLGSLVVITSIPFTNPTPSPKRITTMNAGQTFQWWLTVSRAKRIPELPIITPAERSNSPPIISSATGTAMIAISDASSVQLDVPASEPKPVELKPWPVAVKRAKTAMTPTNEPISGRLRSRLTKPTRASRSSCRP